MLSDWTDFQLMSHKQLQVLTRSRGMPFESHTYILEAVVTGGSGVSKCKSKDLIKLQKGAEICPLRHIHCIVKIQYLDT